MAGTSGWTRHRPETLEVPLSGSGTPESPRPDRAVHQITATLFRPGPVLALVLIAALATRLIWITSPPNALIFDESYYVNASRVLLGWQVPASAPYSASPSGMDPNVEHPPLGKLILAASMLLFGDNGLGWRFPSVVAGMLALMALYLIVRAAGESAWLGVLAVGVFGLDNLALVHSRIGTLDMMALSLTLLGALLALRGRWATAGGLIAIGTLVKLTALYGLLALLILQALAMWGIWRERRSLTLGDFRPTLVVIMAFVVVAIGGLWLLDARFTTFHSPLDHIGHMLEYGANLTKVPAAPGSGVPADSAPWQWPFGEGQITYLRVDVTTTAGGQVISTFPTIDFRGALNPLLIGAIPLAVLFALWFWLRKQSRLAEWAIVWGAANYFPYFALVLLDRRITYLYYFLPVIPALAVATAILLLRSSLPRLVTYGYVALYVIGFAAYFPFRQIP